MKKIKVYIVTYNHEYSINANLATLFASDISNYNVEVNILNNHSNLSINEEFINKVNVLHNVTRPDFSRGHLSRNWNQAIINGFKDLLNPDCDIVLCSQDDTLWYHNCFETLVNIHEKYSFYTCTAGDGVCSYTPAAVINIGLWDERFCGITFQEADYFLRAYLHNKTASSINDAAHYRVLNASLAIATRRNMKSRDGLEYIFDYTLNLFNLKWPNHHINWVHLMPTTINIPSAIPDFFLYPYFEKHVNIENKNYLPITYR